MDKMRILLAEDHKVVREGTRRLLESQDDFEVVGEASDGVEAVELAKTYGSDSSPRFVNGVLGSLAAQQHEIQQLLKETRLKGALPPATR